jgi:predicted GIY-YIG superfamily endonuclease
VSYCYLLHFERPISPDHRCQHYLGFTTDLQRRIAEHRTGQAARLTEVAAERGIAFVVAKVWPDGDRRLERKLKNRHGSRLCPICNQRHQLDLLTSFDLDDCAEISF